MRKPLCLTDNDELHRANVGYLRMALFYLDQGNRTRAAQLLRAFASAEIVRKAERQRLSQRPYESPYTADEKHLHQVLTQRVRAIAQEQKV